MEEEERACCGSFERGRQLFVGVIAISCGEEKLTFHCLLGDDCLLATRFLSTSNRLQHRGQRLAATPGITLTREGLDGEWGGSGMERSPAGGSRQLHRGTGATLCLYIQD